MYYTKNFKDTQLKIVFYKLLCHQLNIYLERVSHRLSLGFLNCQNPRMQTLSEDDDSKATLVNKLLAFSADEDAEIDKTCIYLIQ